MSSLRAKMPASAGGHEVVVRTLKVQEKLDIEAGFTRNVKPDDAMGAMMKSSLACQVRALAEVDGVALVSGSSEQEAAYHALGPKGVALVGRLYDRVNGITEDEVDAFLASAVPVEGTARG